jgi:hypothetical protein
MKLQSGLLVMFALVLITACANPNTKELANLRAASAYASVNKAMKEDQELAKKDFLICFREKPMGTLIAQTVCRSPELMALERERTRDRMTRTEMRSFTDSR